MVQPKLIAKGNGKDVMKTVREKNGRRWRKNYYDDKIYWNRK